MCVCVYKEDLALNNLQWSICHKNKPNQTKPIIVLSKNIAMIWIRLQFLACKNQIIRV